MPLLSFVSLFLWKRKTTLFWPKKGLPPYRGRRQSPKFISHHQNCGPSNPRARREGGGMVLGRKMDQGEHFLKGFYFVLVLLKVAPVFNLIFLFDWICILFSRRDNSSSKINIMGPLYQNGHLLRAIRPECQKTRKTKSSRPKGPKPTSSTLQKRFNWFWSQYGPNYICHFPFFIGPR